MTATKGNAKRSIKVPRGTISRITYSPPKLPDKPPVDEFCKSYGRTKSGQYIVPRFWITPYYLTTSKKQKIWWVIDQEVANVAEGTSRQGYSKGEAKRIAEKYRDKYGAWSTTPF